MSEVSLTTPPTSPLSYAKEINDNNPSLQKGDWDGESVVKIDPHHHVPTAENSDESLRESDGSSPSESSLERREAFYYEKIEEDESFYRNSGGDSSFVERGRVSEIEMRELPRTISVNKSGFAFEITASKTSALTLAKIIERGTLLSSADFKTASGRSFSMRPSEYHEVVKALQEYEKSEKVFSTIETRQAALKNLEQKAEAYATTCTQDPKGLFRKKFDSQWQRDHQAAALLVAGIHEQKELLQEAQRAAEQSERAQQSPKEKGDLLLGRLSPSLEKRVATKCQEARNLLIEALLQREGAKISPEKLPRLIDAKDASALKEITPEKLKEAFGFSPTQMKDVEARLKQLKKHISTVELITSLNTTLKSKDQSGKPPLDIGTPEGYNRYLLSATNKEMYMVENYKPAPHLVGAAIVTDWNQYENASILPE